MTDVTFALAAKSDQLNAVDIIGVEPVIKIRKVEVKKTEQQPVWIYYEGDNNKALETMQGDVAHNLWRLGARLIKVGWAFNQNLL